MDHLSNLIKTSGGISALAEKLGVRYQAIQKWRKQKVPPIRAVQIEKITNGKITRHDLCPDFPWGEAPTKKAA